MTRLNLGCGTDMRTGFINIDLLPNPGMHPDQYQQGDVTNLDWVCGDATIAEIMALNVLQCIPIAGVALAVRNWVIKLQQGGILKISVPDLAGFCNAFASGQMDVTTFLRLTFGQQQSDHDFYRSGIDHANLSALMAQNDMRVDVVRISDGVLYMEATKK